jgi:hypothetical protein
MSKWSKVAAAEFRARQLKTDGNMREVCPHGVISWQTCVQCNLLVDAYELDLLFEHRRELLEQWMDESTPTIAVPISARYDSRPKNERW